ncbi:FMRFamide receptor-like [Pseudomyrmex gracilis]|uniref:FMRFamide receptor-like n=1 Tax=Pseudomyrmex gracilis TaxID=219809 RepID=UPI0009959E16|nr:FMRFamide receptor-like [Pseudomyrmex gracilis]XP_020283224.1 FMRFamide receptor-like [Pseudomyrmex gracilis]
MSNTTLLNSVDCEQVLYNLTGNETIMFVEIISRQVEVNISKYTKKKCFGKFVQLYQERNDISRQYQIDALREKCFPYYILIVLLSLLGNCLSMCVLFGTKLRYSSPSVYLGVLAISDNCYLGTLLARQYYRSKHYDNLFFDKFPFFLLNFCSCLSAWLVIVFTVERYIVIKWPLRRNSFCTVARAKIMIIILTILTILLNIPEFLLTFLYLKSDLAIYRICQVAIIIIIPLIVIIILNILITYNIYKSYRNRRNMTANPITSNEDRIYQNWMLQSTKIFLLPCAFMCFNMPICIMRIILFSVYGFKATDDHLRDLKMKIDNENNAIVSLAFIREIIMWKQISFWRKVRNNVRSRSGMFCQKQCI